MVSCSCFCLTSTEGEPLSPAARLFHEPRFNCYIIAIIGCKTSINPAVIKAGLQETLVHHPRFSSKMVDDDKCRKMRWAPTAINVEEHVIVPNVELNMPSSDKFLEDYVSNLTTKPMDTSKPLWEVHILNVKTSDAEAVGVFKIHHSIGDGASLISLLLACTRKSSDPESLPSIPVMRRSNASQSHGFWWLFCVIWSVLRTIYNTLVDSMVFLGTSVFLKDTETPIKGGPGVELATKRFVHKIVSLDDINFIKDAMEVTVNDVLLGVTQAGLSIYLNRRYADQERNKGEHEKKDNLLARIRVRATILVNLRPSIGIQALADMMAKKSKNKWGNRIGYILLPFTIALQNDPLGYIRTAKSTIDKKKHSFEALCTFLSAKLVLKLFGAKATACLTRKVLLNTTMSFSNVVGPAEEVSFYGLPVAYVAPSVYGHPQALTLHFQSYANTMTVSLAVDPNVIPDPHKLCDDFARSLELMKNAIVQEGSR